MPFDEIQGISLSGSPTRKLRCCRANYCATFTF